MNKMQLMSKQQYNWLVQSDNESSDLISWTDQSYDQSNSELENSLSD